MKDIEALKNCPICNGSGQYCTGNSGSDSDGNAPILERCECYLDNAKALQGDVGEPVAWMREWEGDISDLNNYIFTADKTECDDSQNWIPLFTSPPNTSAKLDKAIEALKRYKKLGLNDIAKDVLAEIEDKP